MRQRSVRCATCVQPRLQARRSLSILTAAPGSGHGSSHLRFPAENREAQSDLPEASWLGVASGESISRGHSSFRLPCPPQPIRKGSPGITDETKKHPASSGGMERVPQSSGRRWPHPRGHAGAQRGKAGSRWRLARPKPLWESCQGSAELNLDPNFLTQQQGESNHRACASRGGRR